MTIKIVFIILQAWVFKHLSTIPASKKVLGYDLEHLLVSRWFPLRGTNKVATIREVLDQL